MRHTGEPLRYRRRATLIEPRLWRREWRGKGREYTSGALVWQINDCWPCVSWAICDYYLRPKPAFYAIARELRPFTVGVSLPP